MSKSSSKICQNCSNESESNFQFCPNCGQKSADGKITFSELWSEFQDAVFNIESRTWRTLKSLFIPGRLTLEYFSGKHRRYVHPLRLLLVTSVLFIIAMSFQNFKSATNHSYNVKERILKNHERQRLYEILENITDNMRTIFSEPRAEVIADSILITFEDSLQNLLFEGSNKYASRYGDRYSDSFDLNHYVSFNAENVDLISKDDFLNKDEDEIVEIYRKDGSAIDRLLLKQKVKFVKDESKLFATLLGHTTWAFLLMMPCLALVLYFLYIRHHYFYVEHLIFTFHVQSFSFLVLTILIGGMNIFPWWLILLFLLTIGIYLYVSIWKVYKQGIGKTLLKFLLLGISYCGVFFLILFGTVFISFLLL